MTSLTMKEYVENALYTELIQMPLWTVSAFGSLEEGQRLTSSDVRVRLITYLVVEQMNKVPPEFYDEAYRSWGWKTSDYFPVIKQAVKSCREILGENPGSSGPA